MQRYATGRYDFGIVGAKAAFIDMMRYRLLGMVRQHKPDYILWLDADQTYPAQTPEILMKHMEDGKMIVGGAVPHRGERKVAAYTITDEGKYILRNDIKPNTGLHKVDGMGLGGVMMDSKVFDIVDTECFQSYWHPTLKSKVGEDVVFYTQCKKHGIDVWCDTDLIYGHLTVQDIGFADDN